MWLRSAISFLLCALTFWAFSATIQAEPTFQANLSLIPGGASEAFSSSSLADGDSRDGAVLRLKYPVSPEHNYLVEYRDTFSPGSWCGGWSLLPAVPHNEGELSIPVESASRFFRVHELEGPRGPLFVTLQNDTGVNRMDRYTADASIAGWIEPSGGLMDLVLSDLANPGGSISLVNLVDEKSGHFTIAQQSIEDSFGSSLGDGEHRFQFQAIDLSGNVSTSKTLEFVLDQTSPVLDIFSPNGSESSASDLYFVDTEFVSIGGWTEPGLQLKLTPGGIEATADEEGSFVFAPVRLSPGSNLFTVSVRDLACNITSRTINLDFGAFEEPEPAKHSQAQALEFNPDWVVGETGGSSEKRGRIGLEDFKPFFESGDSTLLTLEMGFTVPAEASELRIGFSEVSLGSSTENTIRDAFEVILVDEAGNSLVHPIRPGARSREAFFNQTEGLAADIATRAGWDNETKILSLNLAALEPGTEGRLVFRLLSNQQDSRSRVALSGIEVRSGVPVMALSTVAEPVREREPLDPAVFAALQDISAGTEILLGRTSYDARSGTLYSEASLRNATNIGYGGPVVAVVQVLEDPSVRVRDADGLTPEGLPYFHLKSELSGGFGPNQISDNFEIAFFNPEGAPIRFNLKVLALLNRPPVFTGSVPLEVLAGNVYQAYAEAIDPDADPLDFALVSGPAEMTVGALDGAINWLASEDDLGRHSITIRVSDGRGGSDLLEFDLLVRSADSANRPPVFTGLPASAASSEFAYTSTAKAEDPDQDTLTYILVEGPAGLEMDSSTGALTWSPSRSQIGLHAVRIRAEDDRGGSTESEFQISVADFENRAPVITSEPRLRHNLPAEPNAPFGNVAPNGLFLNLEPGESATAQVSIDLPLSETIESGADIVFIVDESGSMAGEHEWLSTMVPELEAALLNFDISPNRYFLAGFTANPRFWNSGTQFHAEVFDPGMRSLGATTWGDVIAEPSLILGFAESGTHTISLEALAGSPSSTYQVRASLAVDSTDVDVAGFDTVFTGTIAPGESIFLPFSGAAGTMVFHDAQDVSSLSRRILAPDGSTVKDLFTRTSSAFTLPVSGDYLIRLWNQGSTERDYRFRLLAASASLPVGTRFDGVLISGDGDEAGRSAEVFRYDGAAGSRLFIQPHVAGNGNFALFDSSGLQLDLGNFNFDSEFEIPLTGSYLFVVYGNDSDAPVPYEFLISESSFETSVISADTIVDTDIAVPGEIDRFAFEGTQGQLVFFDGIASESTQFRSSMIHETGLVLFANAPRSFRDLLDDSGPFFLPRDGTYWITVDGLDEHVGDYAFQILNLSSDLPDIPFDETLSVALNPGESTVAYEFDGSAGERIFADVVAADGRLDWKLYTPSGDPVFSGSPTDTAFKLSETGRHVLLFDGESESDPGVYEIRFRRSPPAAPVAAATNTDIVGTLTEPGEILRYDFVLGKGDRIFFDGRSSDSGDIQAEFRTSYADVLESNRSLTADGGPHTVTESSLHSLFVEAGDSVGEFRYALLKAVDLTSPSVQTGSLGPREAILFRFEGSAGQLLELRDLNNIGTGAWFVYDPFNDSLVSSSFGDDISRVLESDGEHLLLVRANSSTTGVDYDFSLTLSDPPVVAASGFDQINSGNLTPGQLQSFALTASAGAHLYFDQLLEEQTDLRITLQAPDSSEVFSLSSARDSGLVFLAESGGYTLTVENESTADTAPFAFRILSSDDAEVLTFGSTTSGSFAANGAAFGAVLYRFEAVAGQHFHARPEFGDIAHDWALHLANRDRLDHGNFGNLLSWAVASSGTLFLVLSGDSPTETEYSFSAGLEDRSARNVATGTRFDSLTDLPPAGVDRLQFEATAGDRIYVDHLIGTDALRLLLYQPDGTLVFSNIRLDSDVDPYTTTATGTHYLFVESSNDEAEAYALRILLDRETPVLPLGPSQSGTLDPGSQTEIFQFDLSVPTRLRLDREVLSGSAVFRLFDPSGDSIPINNNSSIPIETTEPGTYLFAVIGTSDTTTDYDFQLTPLVETTFDLPTNTTVTGLIEDRNQLTFHTFSGSAGQVIRYRAVSPEPAFNTTYHVYGPGAELLFDGRALDDQLPVELPVDGDYIFVFEKPDETTETFGFRVQDFSGAPLLGGSKLLEGDFVEAEGDALIRVEALAGQTITLTFALDTLSKDAVGILDEFENLSTGQGGTENGYRAIEAAARLPFRQGAAVNFILVTDEDCDCAAPAAELRPELQELLNDIGAKLNTVVNLRIRDGEEPPNDAVGVDSDAIYYRPDGAAGFTTSSTGTVEAGLAPANATARDTVEDYAELAWATGGAAWDLNQLREGGLTAQSFTSAFVTIKAEEILEDLASLDVIASDSSAPFVNLTGPLADVEGGSNAEFSVELVGEENARSFDLLFIRPRSGNILGSLPVVLGYGYRYVVQANDPDGDLLSFSASTAPLGASIDSTTGLFEWQPTATGVFPLTIGVDDGRGGNDQQSFEIEVFAPSGNSVPIIEGTPQGNAIAGRDFSKRIKASDPDGDTLLYLVEEGPDGLTLDIRSGQLTWTPEAGQIGENRIVVRVLDGRGGIAVADFILEVVADSDNRAPAFESAPLSAGAPGEVYRYDAVAVDPDGDTVRYSLAFGPDGMAVGADSGVLTWRPRSDQSGTFSVVLRASDAFGAASLQRFSVRVSGLNSAPVFTSAPPLFAGADQAYGYLPVVQEADGDNLDFFLDQAPAAMTVDQSTGRLLWVPGAADLGLHPITLRALDARGASAVQTFDLNVLSTLDNEAPEIVSTPATLVRLDSVWFYNVLANDPEGFPVEVSLDEAPEGMSVDANGLVSWNTVARSLGSYSVAVRAEDPLGAATVQNFELALVENRPNTAPSITTTPGTSAVAGREYAYDPIATDPEADALTWRLDASPTGMSLSPDSGALRWTPRIDQVGTHTVELSVIDSESASSLQEFEIVVHPVNTAPLIASAPPTTVAAEAAYNYIVAATDAEGDAVVFTLVNGPAGMLLDSNSGLLTWLPELGDVGTHAIEILASDGFGGSARQLFDLEVVDTTPNEPARITSTPALAAQAGLLYSYQLTAEDPESQPLTFSLESGPAGMTLNATGGLVEWQPGTAQAGPNSVELWVTDSAGNVSYQSFTVTVLLENANPAILSAPTGPATVGLPYVYEVVANDPDGDSLQYRIVAGPDEMTIRSDGRITWTPSIGDVGVVAIRIEAFDLLGGVSGQEFNLPVLIDNEPPQVVIQLSENPVLVGTQVEVEVRATDDVAVVSRSAEFGGIPLALDANGRATVVAENPGLFSITATATDGLGNVGMAEQTLVASETLNDEAPFVFIESPLPSSTITQPVLVRATVTDEDLAFYALEIAPADGGDYWEIARGGSVVDDAVTGTLDPTLLDNGIYKLRLVAEDVLGNRSADEFTFDVAGALKLGNYAVSFTDMEVPVAGIPITVSRTYDTLRANRNGRVGYGWRIDVLDTRLRTTLSGDVQEGDEILPAFRFGTRVYVTLPDGRREAFTFEPKLNNRFFPIFDPTFVADPGVDSTLTVDIHDLRFNDVTGEFESYIDRLPYNPAAPAFGGVYRLTTKEGLTYRIEGISGDLSRISDRNGNTLMIDDSGIVANTGERVTFETDPSGRIAAVIDPSGNRVEYGYDAAGDLVRVEDREGNVTTFHYLEDPAHYLSRIEDPLGRTGDRSEYDAEGRLVRRFNGTSGVLEYAYDPGNSLQTSTDALGNTTTYEYDARGNIVAEINPLGGIIRSTYDANDRLLSLTDELGRETLYEYDDGGNVLSRTAPGGLVTSYTYNSLDLPLTITDPLGHTITHTYDAAGNLTSTTDKNGKVTTMVYDPRGNRIRHVAPTGDVTEYEYDGRSRLLRRTDPNGAVRSYTYDANNNPSSETIMVTSPDGPPTELTTLMEYDSEDRLVRQTNAAGEETRFEYDGLDNLTAVVDPSGNRNEIVYNAAGAIASQSFPEGRVVSRTYDLKDRLVSRTAPDGSITRYEYDAKDRLVAVIHPDATPDNPDDNPRERFAYDAADARTEVTDANGATTRYEYGTVGRIVRVIDPLGAISEFTYDDQGNKLTETDPLGNITRFEYDAEGNRVKTTFADGAIETAQYDALGRIIAKTNALGATTGFTYATGTSGRNSQLATVTDPLGNVHEYEYDEAGRLVLRRDPLDRETRITYDEAGRRTGLIRPLGGAKTMEYDENGGLVAVINPDGSRIEMSYDSAGRRIRKDLPDATDVVYEYDLSDRLVSVADGRGLTEFTYDSRNWLSERREPDGRSIAYSYDELGRVTRRDLASGSIHSTYDAVGRPLSVTDPDGGVTTHAYDLAGNLLSTDFPNGVREARTYDQRNRVLSISWSLAGVPFDGLQYVYDLAGRRTQITFFDGTTHDFGYDLADRLVSETISPPSAGARMITYAYDAAGNRTLRTDSAEGQTVYAYDANDRLISATSGSTTITYNYDINGNLTSIDDGSGTVPGYTWDAEGRLLGVGEISYEYDFSGIRVARTEGEDTVRYLVDHRAGLPAVLEEYAPDGTTLASFVRSHRLVSQERSAGRSYYRRDALGSVIALDDALGQSLNTYRYDGFGRPLTSEESVSNSFRFTGEPYDAGNDLLYLRARYYQPGVGRFTSPDPFVGNPMRPSSYHAYQYASANPVNITDPTGKWDLTGMNMATAIVADFQSAFGQAGTTALITIRKRAAQLSAFGSRKRTLGLELVAKNHDFGPVVYDRGEEILGLAMKQIRESLAQIGSDTVSNLKIVTLGLGRVFDRANTGALNIDFDDLQNLAGVVESTIAYGEALGTYLEDPTPENYAAAAIAGGGVINQYIPDAIPFLSTIDLFEGIIRPD